MATVNVIPELEKVEAVVRDVLTWEANWNSYDAPVLDTQAIEHAVRWISALYTDASDTQRRL